MKYICKLCNYESNNKSNYNRHLKTKNTRVIVKTNVKK